MFKALILDGTAKSNPIKRKLETIGFEVKNIGEEANITESDVRNIISVNAAEYDIVTCHLRWASGTNLKAKICDSDWYKSIKDIPIRIGLSDGSSYQAVYKECFDIVDYFDVFKEEIEECETSDQLIEKLKKKSKNYMRRLVTTTLLHFFLPLDIDMQALKTTENAVAYLNDMYAGIEELYKLDKYNGRNKNEHYRQKLYDLWFLLEPSEENKERASPKAKNLTTIDNPPDDLLKLARFGNGNPKKSPIYQFLKSLDERKKDDKDLTEEVKYLLAPFASSGLKGCDGNGINSFHDWYCALASCLRGEEACN